MDAPSLHLFSDAAESADLLPVRGVAWVLRWTMVLAVLAISAVTLTAFGYQLAAERALARAASAGFREAALPRASNRSIEAAIRRRLGETMALNRSASVCVARAGGQITLALAVPLDRMLPRWLPIAALCGGTDVTFRKAEVVGRGK